MLRASSRFRSICCAAASTRKKRRRSASPCRIRCRKLRAHKATNPIPPPLAARQRIRKNIEQEIRACGVFTMIFEKHAVSGKEVPSPITVSASIIIPTFNGAAKLANCLDALVKQTAGRNIEILVVNDGSTDNTVEAVARYSGVGLITQANAGPAAARNRGAR